jgi:hypothetical protein
MTITENVQRYPLQWPTGWAREKFRTAAQFGKVRTTTNESGSWSRKASLSVDDAIGRLEKELDRLGATNPTLSTNLQINMRGVPRGDQSPSDPGAAVYFLLKGKPCVLACDKWTRVADNIAAIAAHIEALRAQERYGVGSLEQAFAGYAALPAAETNAFTVLGLTRDATRDQVVAAHRDLLRRHHPDAGGQSDYAARLNAARDEILRALDAMDGARAMGIKP